MKPQTSNGVHIDIRPSDRACFFGATGTGKTSMARRLLELTQRFVVLDPKAMYTHRGVPVTEHFDPELDRQIVRLPRMHGKEAFDLWGKEIDAAYDRGNIVIYIDEVIGLTGPTHLPSAYAWAVKTGRQRNVAVWSGTQRPMKIPLEIMSESEHFFLFRLQTQADRIKAATFTSDAVQERLESMIDPARPDHHDCLYVTAGGRMLYLREHRGGHQPARR